MSLLQWSRPGTCRDSDQVGSVQWGTGQVVTRGVLVFEGRGDRIYW